MTELRKTVAAVLVLVGLPSVVLATDHGSDQTCYTADGSHPAGTCYVDEYIKIDGWGGYFGCSTPMGGTGNCPGPGTYAENGLHTVTAGSVVDYCFSYAASCSPAHIYWTAPTPPSGMYVVCHNYFTASRDCPACTFRLENTTVTSCTPPCSPAGCTTNGYCYVTINGVTSLVWTSLTCCIGGTLTNIFRQCPQCPDGQKDLVDSYQINSDGNPHACHWWACTNGVWQEFYGLCPIAAGAVYQHYQGDGVSVPAPTSGGTSVPANTLGGGGEVNPPAMTNGPSPPTGTQGGANGGAQAGNGLGDLPSSNNVNVANLSGLGAAVQQGMSNALAGAGFNNGTIASELGTLNNEVAQMTNISSGTFTESGAFVGTVSNANPEGAIAGVQSVLRDLGSLTGYDISSHVPTLASAFSEGIGSTPTLALGTLTVFSHSQDITLDLSQWATMCEVVRAVLLLMLGVGVYFAAVEIIRKGIA